MDVHAVLKMARDAGVQMVRFMYCGNDGVIRGKATHVDYLEHRLEAGLGLTVAMQSFTMLDQLAEGASFGPVGEVRLIPDRETFRIVPYARSSARLLCDLYTLEHEPWEVCPRSFLKRMIARAAGQGYLLKAAFENEFYLARQTEQGCVPFDTSPCFSSIGMDSADAVISDIIAALNKQHVHVEQYYPELGPGQQEIPVRYGDALGAADNQLIFRDTVRGVAAAHGLVASLAPKPFAKQAGNSSHLHFSIWDGQGHRNLFFDAQGQHGLSDLGRHFLAGVLHHLPGLLALTAASVNSYRRLQPRFWSSAYISYGPDNREASIRIASRYRQREMESTNLELKPVDSSSNPYLALGGVLACGLDGVACRLPLGEPARQDPDALPPEERRRLGISRYPLNLAEALAALETDALLRDALGAALHREYLIVKRAEWKALSEMDETSEIAAHFYKY